MRIFGILSVDKTFLLYSTMQESHRIELKSRLTDSLEKEVVAFLNSREGGEIYIGYNDDGTILGVENADDVMLNINNRLRSRISPSIMGLFAVELENMSDLQVIKVSLSSGSEKPYFITSKGMSIRGCFLRVGTAAEPMEQRMIDDLFSKRTRNSLRKIRSNKQDLTFEQLKIYFQEQGLTLNEHFATTLEFLTEDGTFNYVAYLMADNNSTSIKVARYSGLDRSDLIESPELGHCSLVKSAKQILDMFDLKNTVITEITGKERKQSRAWDPIALREAVLNALVHNDFTYEVPPKFEFFKDRIEITSAGGLPQGLSQEEFFEGFSVPRNKEIMRIFRDLRLVEQLGSGIPRILHSYSRDCFRFSENFVRMTFNSAVKSSRVIQQGELVDGLVERLVEGLVENQKKMVFLINNNSAITLKELAESIGISTTAIDKNIAKLKEKNIIRRVGGDKGGSWEIIRN